MSDPLWLDGQDIFGFTVEKQEILRPGHAPYYVMPGGGTLAVSSPCYFERCSPVSRNQNP